MLGNSLCNCNFGATSLFIQLGSNILELFDTEGKGKNSSKCLGWSELLGLDRSCHGSLLLSCWVIDGIVMERKKGEEWLGLENTTIRQYDKLK